MATIPEFLAELRKRVDGCPASDVLYLVSQYAREAGRLERITLCGGGRRDTDKKNVIAISLGADEHSCCWVSLDKHAIEFRTTRAPI